MRGYRLCELSGLVLPPSLIDHPAAELPESDPAALCEHRTVLRGWPDIGMAAATGGSPRTSLAAMSCCEADTRIM